MSTESVTYSHSSFSGLGRGILSCTLYVCVYVRDTVVLSVKTFIKVIFVYFSKTTLINGSKYL